MVSYSALITKYKNTTYLQIAKRTFIYNNVGKRFFEAHYEYQNNN